MKYIGAFLILLLIPFGLAQNIHYDIEDKNVAVSMEFNYNGYFNILLPSDYSDLKISSDDYFFDSNYLVINGDGSENISFNSKLYIEKSGSGKIFISDAEYHLGSNIQITLPLGNTLRKDKIIFPGDYELKTDGEKIIIAWESMKDEEILLSFSENSSHFIYYVFTLIVITALILFYFYNTKKKKDSKMKNLFHEEKKIMKYLLKKRECWTKEMVRDLDISKVKLSRKLRNLEEKGLIERVPHGNENRIKVR